MARAQKKLTKKDLRQDPLMKAVSEAQEVVQVHGRKIGIGTAFLVVVILAVLLFASMRNSANREALIAVAQARQSYMTSSIDSARVDLQAIVDRYKGTQGGGEALFSLAEIALMERRFEDALDLYRQFIKRYHIDPLLKLAAMEGEATVLEDLGRFEEAAEKYDRLVKEDGFGYVVPLALYHAGRCYASLGKMDLARERYRKVVEEYKDAPIRADAERELVHTEILKDLEG